jgi:GTP cyclohydrolase FolE2
MIIDTDSLPTYRRRTPAFSTLFGVPAERALTAMNEADDDVVSHRPRVPVGLRSVGYTQRAVPVRVTDPFGSGAVTTAICRIAIGCPVPASRRGVHMSRLGDALARSILRSYPDLAAYARELAEAVAHVEYGGPASVRLSATIPYLEDVAGGARTRSKLSLEHLTLLARARLADEDGLGACSDSGLRFSHIVACPCVQRMYRHARAVASDPLPPNEDDRPVLTHSQRCITSVLASGLQEPLDVAKILAAVDAVVVRTVNTLPRDVELATVYRAHRTPQFIEDALRETLWALYQTLHGTTTFACLRGWSRSQESIHGFDLKASAVLTEADVRSGEGAAIEIEPRPSPFATNS